jgi:hypothetical protein
MASPQAALSGLGAVFIAAGGVLTMDDSSEEFPSTLHLARGQAHVSPRRSLLLFREVLFDASSAAGPHATVT